MRMPTVSSRLAPDARATSTLALYELCPASTASNAASLTRAWVFGSSREISTVSRAMPSTDPTNSSSLSAKLRSRSWYSITFAPDVRPCAARRARRACFRHLTTPVADRHRADGMNHDRASAAGAPVGAVAGAGGVAGARRGDLSFRAAGGLASLAPNRLGAAD